MGQINSVADILNENGDLDDTVLLGRIVMFTITDEHITRQDLENRFLSLGLDTDMLPPEIKPIDAFKKATSEAKEKYDLPGGRQAIVLCRDVSSNAEYVRRQITREVKDSRARTLSYSKAIDCTFYRARTQPDANGRQKVVKGSERVQIKIDPTDLDQTELTAVKQIAQNIEQRYQQYYNHLDGNRLRATVRDYLKHLNAIEIKGGVYFVHVKHSDELQRLQTLVDGLGGGCMMHSIPLVDIERERKMIALAFEREASESLQDIAKECAALKGSRKSISPAAYARIKEQYDEVVEKANEHMVTLQVSHDITGAAAEVALKALLDLQETMLGGEE